MGLRPYRRGARCNLLWGGHSGRGAAPDAAAVAAVASAEAAAVGVAALLAVETPAQAAPMMVVQHVVGAVTLPLEPEKVTKR